jgi:hypothetical protein
MANLQLFNFNWNLISGGFIFFFFAQIAINPDEFLKTKSAALDLTGVS